MDIAGPPVPTTCPTESPCRIGAEIASGISRSALGRPLPKQNLPLHKWAMAIYLELTSLKSIASTKLASDIGVSQPAAWFMLHRIREAWTRIENGGTSFSGPVEVDETYMGGKRRNMSKTKRAQLSGRGPVGKMAVAGDQRSIL